MSKLKLYTNKNQQVTCISNIFIDTFMPEASGEFLKIYLYLLRMLSEDSDDFSISDLADKFHYTEKDVLRGLSYWEQKNLLQIQRDSKNEICGICLLEPVVSSSEQVLQEIDHSASFVGSASASAVSHAYSSESMDLMTSDSMAHPSADREPLSSYFATTETKSQHSDNLISIDEPRHYSASEISEFKQAEGIRNLLFVAEQYIGHPLNLTETERIIFWHSDLHFSADLIEYLIEYCVENNHSSFHYMNKVALNWHQSGITTLAEAKANSSIHAKTYYGVMKAFGISGRNLNEREIAYISKWTGSFGFNADIITEACERTIQNTNKSSFKYADSILCNWHDSHITKAEDIAKLDADFASKKAVKSTSSTTAKNTGKNNTFKNYVKRDLDDDYYDKLEQELLRK